MGQLRQLKGLQDKQVDEAVKSLTHVISANAQAQHFTMIEPGTGTGDYTAYWVKHEGFWAIVDPDASNKNRKVWCSFGTADPVLVPTQNFLFQINVQALKPWNPFGAFATDGKHTYYLHNGKIKGRPAFAERYPGERVQVQWANGTGEYFVVGRLDDSHFIRDLGTYVRAVETFKRDGTLAEVFRGKFEMGLADAILDLQGRVAGVPVAAHKGDVDAARQRLEHLSNLQEWLKYDRYLLQEPVERITKDVQDDRRRRLVLSILAAAGSILVGWLLSGIRPDQVFSLVVHH